MTPLLEFRIISLNMMSSISIFPESPQRLIQRNRVASISGQNQSEVATFLDKAGQLLLSFHQLGQLLTHICHLTEAK